MAVFDSIVFEYIRVFLVDFDVGKGGSYGDIGFRVEAVFEGRARYLGCFSGFFVIEESFAVGFDGAFNRRGFYRGWGTFSEEFEGLLWKEFF